jgi:hypothetical protein
MARKHGHENFSLKVRGNDVNVNNRVQRNDFRLRANVAKESSPASALLAIGRNRHAPFGVFLNEYFDKSRKAANIRLDLFASVGNGGDSALEFFG